MNAADLEQPIVLPDFLRKQALPKHACPECGSRFFSREDLESHRRGWDCSRCEPRSAKFPNLKIGQPPPEPEE